MDTADFAAFQAQAAAFGYALHPTDEAPPYAPADPKVSAAVGQPVAAAEKSTPAAAHPNPLKPATRPKPVQRVAPAQATQRVAPQTVEKPAAPAVRAASAAPAARATSAAPAMRAASAAPSVRSASAAPTVRAAPAAPTMRAASAAPAVRVASVAPAIRAVAAGPAIPAGPAPLGKATSCSVSASRVAPSGRVASANRSRSATPVMQPYPPAMSQAESETLHRELLTMRQHLPPFVVTWVPNRPSGSPGRGEYNLEETFGLSTDVYWTIRNVCRHALLRTPGIDMTKPITLQRPKGIVRKVVNTLTPVFPEFDDYSLVDNYALEDFCHAILRSSANTFGQQKKNPERKSRKRGGRRPKSEEVEETLNEVEETPNEVAGALNEVADEVANEVANEDMAEPLNDPDEVMDDIVNDAGGDVGMWDDAECEPIATPAPLATLANDPTDDLIGNFSTISIQPDDEESADTLPQALLTPALMQMSPPRAKPNLALASTLPATYAPRRAATQATPSISTATSTATSTASTMSTSTASSMATSTGAPARRPPGTPKSPGFYVNSKMLGQMEEIMELPEDERAGRFSSVLQNLLLGMAAGKLPATNPTSSTGQGDPNSEMNAPLEFESEPGSDDLQGADDSGSLSDPPNIEGEDVGCGSKSGSREKAGNTGRGGRRGGRRGRRGGRGGGRSGRGSGGGGGEGRAKGQGAGGGAAGDSSTKNSKASLSVDEAVDEGEEMGEGPRRSTRNRNPSNDTTDKGKAPAKAPAAAKPTTSSRRKK